MGSADSGATDVAAITRATVDPSVRAFNRRIIGSMVLGFAILAAVVVGAGVLLLRAQDFAYWVDHTYAVETRIADFRVQLERIEAARRGYLLSGQPRYAALYDESERAIAPIMADLRRMTTDNPREQRRLQQLEPLLKAKLALLRQSMEQRRTGGTAAGLAGFQQPAGQTALDDLRELSAAMTQDERELLAVRNAQATGNVRLLLLVVVLAGVLLAMVAGGSSWIMRRYARALDRSQAQLRGMNEGLEEAVRARTVDLTRANQEIQRFAYIVSHDLRSPLVNIMGFTSELEAALKPLRKLLGDAEDKAPEIVAPDARLAVESDLPESIGFIRSSAQKMDRLISAILKLSREGRRTLNPEPLDMNALVEGVLAATQTQIHERAAEVTIEGALPGIVSDRVALDQVFSNLIENALKYLEPSRPGRIVVRGRAQGDRVVYEVEDNGRGIAPKDHERIFDLFRRAGRQDQPGEGIGLAHVRTLVYRLNGLIDCVSTLDQGATFRVSLPRVLIREEGEPS